MRSDVFEVVKRFAASPAAESLDEYQRHFLDAVVNDFTRGGLSLDEKGQEQLRGLLAKDAELCSSYGSNVRNDDTRLLFTKEELAGLPDEYMAARIDKESGKVAVTLAYPDVVPVGSKCSVASTRKAVVDARGKVVW